MAGFIKVDAKRVETTALNTRVNKEVFTNFKIYAKELGYPMNVLLETFMNQYANGKFHIDEKDITKFKTDDYETEILNTTFNKEIYTKFKSACKNNGYFVKHVVMAFMKIYASRKLMLEFTNKDNVEDVNGVE